MNKRWLSLISVMLIATVLLSGCRLQSRAQAVGGQAQSATRALISPSPSPTRPTATPRPSATPTATPVPETAKAAQVVQDYFAALEKDNFDGASEKLSTFSLTVLNMTRGDASNALHGLRVAGGKWSGLQVVESRPFDPLTTLVHVRYTYTSLDPKTNQPVTSNRDELWPVRDEAGVLRYNWGNLIDYRTLDTPAQTTSGITILPQQVRRYSDRVQLVMLMQNSTNQSVVFGQPNETLATFHFGDQTIPAQKTQIILEPLRSKPDVTFDIPGLFTTYPDSVEIRKWNNYKVPPWYVFDLQT